MRPLVEGSLRTRPVNATPLARTAKACPKASLKNTAVIAPWGPLIGILHFRSQAFNALILKLYPRKLTVLPSLKVCTFETAVRGARNATGLFTCTGIFDGTCTGTGLDKEPRLLGNLVISAARGMTRGIAFGLSDPGDFGGIFGVLAPLDLLLPATAGDTVKESFCTLGCAAKFESPVGTDPIDSSIFLSNGPLTDFGPVLSPSPPEVVSTA